MAADEIRYGMEVSHDLEAQPQFGQGACESIQYELFFGDKFLSVRVKKTPSCSFSDAWVYDGTARDLFASFEPWECLGDGNAVNLRNRNISVQGHGDRVDMRIRTDDGEDVTVKVKETRVSSWRFPPNDAVIHQPLLIAEATLGAETWHGHGYCKRYWYGQGVGYMNWRFIVGLVDGDTTPTMVWTADASFDLKKYDYFKMAAPEGGILSGEQPGSYHRDRMAFGVVEGLPYRLEIADLGRVTRILKSDKMDLKMEQAFCSLTMSAGDQRRSGYALNEIACGTSW